MSYANNEPADPMLSFPFFSSGKVNNDRVPGYSILNMTLLKENKTNEFDIATQQHVNRLSFSDLKLEQTQELQVQTDRFLFILILCVVGKRIFLINPVYVKHEINNS